MTAALTSVGIQQVSITIANGSATGTATITAVGSGAHIIYQGETTTDSTTAVSSLARIELTSSTTVTATRNTASTDTITINAVIIDGDTTNLIKTVQSGTITIASGSTSATASISAVTNNNTATAWLGESSTTAANINRQCTNISLSVTTVTASRGVSTGAVTAGFCAIEYQGSALNSATQNVSIALSSGTSATAAITSVTTANTLLINGGFISSANSANEARTFQRLSLTNATTVTSNINAAVTSGTDTSKCVVVEFVSAILAQNIQRGTITITAGTSNPATITSSPTTETVCNWLNNDANPTSYTMAGSYCRITQTNATTLTMSLNTSGTSIGSYEVADFNPVAVAVGIAFDAASNSGYQTAQSTYSWNHTVTGSNTYLTVGIGMLSVAGSSVSSVTFNGVTMAFLGAKASVSGAVRAELWGLVAPTTGTHSISVTLTTSLDSAGGAVSYTGVNQVISTEALNSASATNVGAADATVSITTIANNDWVVDIAASDDTTITIGAGNTSRSNVTGTLGSGAMGDTNGAITPAGAQAMSWTNVGALATWSIVGVALRPIGSDIFDFMPFF
jgi:hypothetical protein